MTRGELEKEAEEYAIGLFPNDVFRQSAVIQGIIKFTEPREKRIAELKTENNKLLDVINNQDVKIADLKQQIEKMKCCENCGNFDKLYNRCKLTRFTLKSCLCKDMDKWEIKEK